MFYQKKEYRSVIVEFHLGVKKMTSKDKYYTCKKNIQPTKLLKILDQVSISKEKVLKPFWNSHTEENSKKLWLPTKIDSVDLDMNSSNLFFKNKVEQKSWFSMTCLVPQKKKLQKISSKFLRSLERESTDFENIKKKKELLKKKQQKKKKKKKEKVIKSKKIQLYLTLNQIIIFKKFIGTYRFFYNKTINHINNLPRETTYFKVLNNKGNYILNYNELGEKKYFFVGANKGNYNQKYQLVEEFIYLEESKKKKNMKIIEEEEEEEEEETYDFINNEYILNLLNNGKFKKIKVNQTSLQTMRPKIKKETPNWLEECNIPSHLIDYAIKEASEAYSNAVAQFKITRKIFTLKRKKKQSITETINIEKCFFSKKKESMFYSFLPKNEKNIKSNCSFKDLPKKDSSITYHKVLKKWILNIPFETNRKNDPAIHDCVALDPGIRTFQDLYSPTHSIEIGKNACEEMIKIGKRMDNIQSQMTKKENNKYKKNHKRRQILRKLLHKQIQKIKNLRDELHWKTCNFLCKNYKKIYLPEFNVKEMMKTLSHNISRKVINLSHYMFKRRLESKCNEYNRELKIVTEEYTSKTCTRCGNIKNDLGSKKIYKCKKCKLIISRDKNGSRNIFLKNH
jgi:IS605 OrfB family transposase